MLELGVDTLDCTANTLLDAELQPSIVRVLWYVLYCVVLRYMRVDVSVQMLTQGLAAAPETVYVAGELEEAAATVERGTEEGAALEDDDR